MEEFIQIAKPLDKRSRKIAWGGAYRGHTLFDQIVSFENLFWAWREFRKGKRRKPDVQTFESQLEDNLFELHEQLVAKTYVHDRYESFFVTDPKLRHIHKATVRDRILHQAV